MQDVFSRPPARLQGNMGHSDTVPVAYSRIVIGARHSFIYVEYCPLCGLEHMHGRYPLYGEYSDPLQAFFAYNGHRSSHCSAHGLGMMTKMARGELVLVEKQAPPEYRMPQGGGYQLVLGPKPVCFTPAGFKSRDARAAMALLARRDIPTSSEILQPRRQGIRSWRC